MTNIDKNGLYGTLTFLTIKMRTNYSWKAVEPILEMRKIGESYHMVGVTHYVQFWNPDPLFSMETLNNEMTLSIERPTSYSHCLIVPKIENNDGWKLSEPEKDT